MTTHINEIEPTSWVHPTSKAFPMWVTKTFQGYEPPELIELEESNVQKERLELFPHQRFIRDYMQHKSPYRGLLLYHGLGVGKTCASIAVAEIMRNQRDVMIMLPASLEMNYRNEIMRCGDENYAINQHWKFKDTKQPTKVATATGLEVSLVKKMKGYWIVDATKKPNFYNMGSNEQQQIRAQMNNIISKKYEFFRYNGMTSKKFKEMSEKQNIFDNKLVIIDEAHLFISTVVNKSKLSTEIYKDLINAKNIKLVLLTGTPIINYPHELAYTLNLLNGITNVYKIYYKGNFGNEYMLNALPHVHNFDLKQKSGHKRVEIILTPPGFVKHDNGRLTYVGGKEETDEEKIATIVKQLTLSGVNISKYSDKKDHFIDRVKLFPTDKEEFDKYFIDYENNDIMNENLFMRRMMGIVSYYESSDLSLYPENLGVVQEELFFSDHQFNKYAQTRDTEIKKEEKSQTMKKMGGVFEQSGVFKTFSRVLCNFAFPDDIERPFPKKRFSYMNTEMDIDDETSQILKEHEKDMNSNNDAKKKYDIRIKMALKELDSKREEYLTDNLATYSPKYAKITENMSKTKGTSLIYSQFRTMEGLGILGIALKARGFAEMKINIDKNNKIEILVDEEDYMKPKYAMFSTDKEVSNIILKIFNSELNNLDENVRDQLKMMDSEGTNNGNLRGSLIKVLMITQSGSAGISLKNVRQVHIIEPYWNKSRIDQVIGRANRTRSHINLPKDERNFKVFMYRMKMTPEQSKKSVYIKSKDKMKSTDESIYALAQRKDKIISKLLHTIKKGSIDCALHTNNNDIECFSFPLDVNEFERTYLVRIEDDYNNVKEHQAVIKIKVKPYKVIINSNEYIWIPSTNELFDMNLYRKSGVLDKIGTLDNKKNGWYKLVLFKNKKKKNV